ncbi:DWNN domain [Macleaya cordata]|uniref:DWNN domain n=1 Tax=Macleaya cordata TaxID=56857 RepID=A0A200Q4N1_MACCD|nr:DWNN domain [Macleaya cordata]
MAVYYKFKSAKDYDSIPIDGHFISVANLKEKIFESKHLGRGTDFDLMVANAQTNEEYLDEATLIPKNTSVLVRRVPGRPRMTIVTEPEEKKTVENKVEEAQPAKSSFTVADSSVRLPEENEWDEFGNDLYAIPEVLPVQSSNPVMDAPPPNKADEDSKIRALIDTPALDWQRQTQDGFGAGRGYGRGMGGRMMGPGRGFGRGAGLERKTPPPGYTCHRCKVPGHFIQHCPTNGDPNYDIKRVKPPTGIPKSMLMATPDGSYALPSGAVAVLKPNEAAFEKEIEGLPSTRSVSDLPPELRCPLCKEVMKDAVLTSKCCFKSFCDKCIRDHIISKLVCICGATNVLADDLLPNKTLRDTINRILESNNSSADNGGSMLQIQDMESARSALPRVPSPTLSAASKGEQVPPTCKVDNTREEETAVKVNHGAALPQQSLEKGKATKAADISEATLESMSVKEPTLQGNAPPAEEEVQQKLPTVEPGKKKKKKKALLPVNGMDLQWRTPQDLAAENYMMPFAPSACNPYWGGMQLGMDGYMAAPYMGNMGNMANMGNMPYMGYVPGPFDVPLGGIIPQDPFAGQGYMMPVVPPPRDLAEFAMGSNQANPIMSREEFEARKADLRRKREMERRSESREYFKDRESGREMGNSGDVSSMKSKSQAVIIHSYCTCGKKTRLFF